jgi:predicted dehydrogenase
MPAPCNVALIGQKFMGRVHSNAYLKAPRFFDLPRTPVMHTVAGRNEKELAQFAARWGWQNYTTSLKEIARSDEIDLVDIGTPNNMHYEQAIMMLEAGKSVACEKPLALNLKQAAEMVKAAKKAKKARTFVWYNYRRCPSIALAHQLVSGGKLGKVYHVRAVYLQGWASADIPLIWRFDKKVSGSGAHGDLNAHIVDMARFITGEEIAEISGAAAATFVKERTLPTAGPAGMIAAGTRGGSRKKGKVEVDDAVVFCGRMSGGGLCTFEATRFAMGNQNNNCIEVNCERGSVRFSFEDMNVLWWFDAQQDPKTAGWQRIMCTNAGAHPYAAAWWPDAHVLGYEHAFINMVADMMKALANQKPVVPLPDFADAYETQRVLEAALLAAKNRCAVKLAEVK